MNVHKHMEAIFVVTLAAAGLGSYAFDRMPQAEASNTASASALASEPVMRAVAAPRAMPVVVVRGHKAPRHA